MPYISQKARDELSRFRFPETPGELNYWITNILLGSDIKKEQAVYISIMGYINNHPPSYNLYNSVVGVLSCVSMEISLRFSEAANITNNAKYSCSLRNIELSAQNALQAVFMTFYKSVVAPYERQKRKEHGDLTCFEKLKNKEES